VLELADASGGNSIVRGVVTVNAGATLTLTGGDGTGFGWSNTISHLNINGGMVNATGGSHIGFGASVNVALNGWEQFQETGNGMAIVYSLSPQQVKIKIPSTVI
jgi:hypothetical protein